ncbi:MAG: GHKL domain-containing protein [Coriobacteriia bacterium]|nr:GHKL domain-containing protein [Coriobacteriia bacterium]
MKRPEYMRGSYRARLVLGYILVATVLAAAWIWSMYGPLNTAVVNQEERNLTQTARAAALYANASTEPIGDVAKRLVANSDLRLTVVSADGTVLADTNNDASTMENHLSRPEIAAALKGEVGISRRVSSTEDKREIYVAVPATIAGKPAALRISRPLTDVEQIANTSRSIGLGLLLAALAIVAGIATWASGAAALPIRDLSAIAKRMASGDLHSRVPEVPADLKALADALETLQHQMRDRIDALEGEQKTLRAALDGLTDAVFLLDGTAIHYANRAAGRIFRAATGDRREVPLARSGLPESLVAAILGPLGERRHVAVDLDPDPFGRTLRLLVVPLDAAENGRTLVVVTDITERARLDRMRRDFVANASHELKTPVAGIQLLAESAETAAEDGDAEQSFAFTRQIEAEAARLKRLVGDLLDLSRLESIPSPDAVTDVRQALDNALVGHRTAAGRKGLTLSADLSAVRGIDVFAAAAEPTDVAIVLDNLIDNAIAYTAEGSVRVSVEATPSEVRLLVTDTGPGIESEHLPRIFERFYRIDRARSRESGGTGLGLALVRHVAERSGGSVTVSSEVGVGTTFTVTLPRAQ